MGEAVEDFLVQTLVAELAIKALYDSVLGWLTRRDIMPGDARIILPFQDRTTGEFGAVVGDNGFRFSVQTDVSSPHRIGH